MEASGGSSSFLLPAPNVSAASTSFDLPFVKESGKQPPLLAPHECLQSLSTSDCSASELLSLQSHRQNEAKRRKTMHHHHQPQVGEEGGGREGEETGTLNNNQINEEEDTHDESLQQQHCVTPLHDNNNLSSSSSSSSSSSLPLLGGIGLLWEAGSCMFKKVIANSTSNGNNYTNNNRVASGTMPAVISASTSTTSSTKEDLTATLVAQARIEATTEILHPVQTQLFRFLQALSTKRSLSIQNHYQTHKNSSNNNNYYYDHPRQQQAVGDLFSSVPSSSSSHAIPLQSSMMLDKDNNNDETSAAVSASTSTTTTTTPSEGDGHITSSATLSSFVRIQHPQPPEEQKSRPKKRDRSPESIELGEDQSAVDGEDEDEDSDEYENGEGGNPASRSIKKREDDDDDDNDDDDEEEDEEEEVNSSLVFQSSNDTLSTSQNRNNDTNEATNTSSTTSTTTTSSSSNRHSSNTLTSPWRGFGGGGVVVGGGGIGAAPVGIPRGTTTAAGSISIKGSRVQSEQGKPLPQNITHILSSWCISHSTHPFPNIDEKITLMRDTGLTSTQLRNWLTNYRKRHWKPVTSGDRLPRNELELAVLTLTSATAPPGTK